MSVEDNAESLKGRLKSQVPAWLLDAARFVYSPAYRGHRAVITERALIGAAREPLLSASGGRVVAGPLAGMRCAEASVCSAWTPKLLGTYEKELHEVVSAIIATPYGLVIDIGAAEGYYAVGLALKMPQTRVEAFEATAEGRALLQRAIADNGVAAQVAVKGLCKPLDLAALLNNSSARVLVICDAEGAEVELLDTDLVPQLCRCDVLVELHPWAVENPGRRLADRFNKAGALVQVITANERHLADYPAGLDVGLDHKTKLACMNEGRPPAMKWLWIQASV